MNEDNIRALIVDDAIAYRKIIGEVLSGIPGIEVVGTAANGKIALSKIERLRPDILTLDLEMPEMDGLEVLRWLKQEASDIGVILLSGVSMRGANATMTALKLGAFDFVAKPLGGLSEENLQILQQELHPKIESFARSRRVHNILHRNSPVTRGSGAVAPRASLQSNTSPFSHIDAVAIGISTGGPQALNQMLPQLPSNLPVPIFIVQHMPPLFTKSLADDLDKRCAMTVSEAIDGRPVVPGHVLIAPGGKQMKVVLEMGKATIRITDDPPINSCRPSVDYLFRSVTRIYGSGAIGVIMTGMGNDGAQGCRQLKQRGASIIAQDQESCVVFGMPREPVKDGIVDIVAPLNTIASEIVRLVEKGTVEKEQSNAGYT